MKRRILALLLTLVMLVGMIPTSVFADEAAQETISAPVEETEAPVLETEAPQTQPPVTEAPETEAPETQAPTQAPETEAPATEAPETQAPTEETEEALDVMAEAADPVTVSFTVSQQGVLAKTSDGTAAVELPVTVTDVNSDGILTFDEALVALHEAYCPDGTDGYKTVTTSVTKLWGKAVTGPIFVKNDKVLTKAVNYSTSTVSEGDKLYAASVEDTVDLSDCLSHFDKTEVTVEAGKEFTLTLKAAGEYWSGGRDTYLNAYGISVGTWEDGSFKVITGAKTAANGNVTLSFAKAGTYIVTANGILVGEDSEGYDMDCRITAPYCVVTVKGSSVEPAANAEVTFTVSNKGVLATTSDGKAAIELPVTVTDRNSDGILTYDEALVALHETYCPGGYEIVEGFVEKLWDVTTTPKGSYYFLKNNVALSKGVNDKTSTVAQGDKLYCCVFTDEKNWSDAICYFTQTEVAAQAGKAFTLNLQGGSSMAVGGYNPGNLAGAQVGIWKDGKFTAIDGAVTDKNGNVTLTLNKAGTYIISASGEIQTQIADWGTGDGTKVITVNAPLTAPYCVVTVTGTVVTYANVTFSYQEAGNQEVFAFDEKIASNLAESYGYRDLVEDGVSALDVLVHAHELVFFDQFTPENATDFLAISDANWVTKRMGEESLNLGILVNGKQAAGSDGKGLMVNQTKVVDGDYVTFGVYEDAAYYLDKYVWLETADGKPLTGQTFYANTDLDLVVKSNYAAYGDPVEVVEGAQLATMDMKTGKIDPITGKISDKDGKISLHIPEELANKKLCFVITGVDETMTALNVFQVGDVLKETDLIEVHLGIGSSEDTIRELTLNPTFVHDTMDYTVEPLDFVEEEAARRLWVKVEYIDYCTAGFNFHGVTKTLTAEQNRKWVRLDKLVPGAEASVLTLTSTAKGGFDKTYTVTVSMEKGKALLWKTDLTGEALTIGQNTQNTLTVEAGYTKDVTDSPAINYQWYVNTTASTEGGKAVAGATEATLTIPSDTLGTFYYYAVASSTGLESATSKIVEVTVKAVPKSITLTSDYPYSFPSTSTNALGGVTYAVKQGTTMRLKAVDENGEETPVIWKNEGAYGGKFDTETGIYTINSASYTYVSAVSALDSNVSSGKMIIDVKFYAISDYYKNQNVALSTDGQSVKKVSVIGGVTNYNSWEVQAPDGVMKLISKPDTTSGSLEMNVLRPGTVDVKLTVNVSPEGVEKLTDTATINVTGVAVENDQGGQGKVYLELTSDNKAPTTQLKAYTESGRTVASWSSADETIATVDENGVVTAHAVGSVIITATDDKGTKGGILAVVSDSQNPTFEKLALFGINSSTFKYDVNQKDYTGIKLSNYSTKILTINKGTLYDSDKLDCVATYTNEDGEAVSIPIPSATQTQLPGMPFGTTLVTLTLTDKTNKDVKSIYTLEITRVRDTTKTLGANSSWGGGPKVGLYAADGSALSSTLYLDKAEGYLFQASEAGVKNSTYTWTNSKYYYRAFMQNGRADFAALLKGQTDYVHVRYSTDDGITWKELAQGGGQTDAITFPEVTEEGKNAEVKLTVQVVCDDAYFAAGNAYPEMTASKEKLLVPSETGNVTVDGTKYTQVGTTYTFWVEQLPQVEQPRITTATATDGDWYPAFDPEAFSYRLSIPTDSAAYPVLTFTVGEGCTVKLGTKALTADEDGNYTLQLTSSEQKVNVTLNGLTQTYVFSSSKRVKNGADKLTDYLCINSQYSNGASQAFGLYGENILGGTLKSLGNFGGYATFYFEDGLKDDPTNQYGVDFYVDGNAFVDTSTGTGLGSMEPGQVWVSEDGNTWYALAGSQHYTNAIWDYTVTYTRSGSGLHWSDNYGNTDTSVPNRTFQWPRADVYFLNDLVDSDTITLSGILIPSVKGIVGPDDFSTYSSGAKFGYVDVMQNGTDNPYGYNDDYKVESSGFDLAWAVDGNGNPVNVSGKSFHYVKVVTASNIVAGAANEKSTEVSRVYRASSTGASVGQTPAPTAITFSGNGITYSITPEEGKQIYELVLPMNAPTIQVEGGAQNIYVNDQRIASDAASKAIAITKDNTLVRVIVQSGDMEPTIYLLKLSCRDITGEVTEGTSTTLIGGKSMKLTAVDRETGKTIPASSITWALENPDDAAYATVTADGTVKSYVVASKHDVTFLGALKNGYSGFVMHTITIYPPVSLVEIYSGDKNVTGETLYLNGTEGTELALTAKLYPTDGKEGVTWKSSNTKVLTVEDGTVRYVAGTGTVTVTATANDGSKKSASVKVQVGLLTQSVTITEPETTTLRSGKSLTLKATTEPVKPTVSGVTFRLVNSADSVYATVAANGKVTAKTVNEPHAVQVVAASKDGQAKSEPITLTILPKSNQTLILKSGTDYVTKTTLIRNIGETIALKAYTLDVSNEVPTEVEAENVTWKSSKTKVATVDETGKIGCLAKGKATISALVDGKVQATVTVSVTTLVESLTIGSKTGSFTLASGKKLNLTAAVAPAEAANKAVTWAITEGSEYAKISGSGVVTANKNLTVPVTVTVQAAAKDGSGVTAQQEITINPLSYGVEIKRPNASENTTLIWDMADRNVIRLSAKVYPLSAEQSVTWKSSNAKVASIDASGKITCLKAGTVTITATANDGSGKKASFKLQIVKLMKFLGLVDVSVAGGKSVTLKPLIGPADTTNKKLAWSVSENKYGIKINGSGKVSTKAVTEPVNVTVTVSALDGSGVSASCEVTVYPATTKVTISAKGGELPASISVDTTLELTASSQPAGTAGTYTWKSSNEKIAAVDANGVVTAIKAGKVKITCTAADGTNKSASVTLKIVEAIETPPKL